MPNSTGGNSDANSPWGEGGSGKGGKKPTGSGGNSPWGSGGGNGQRPPSKGQQSPDLDNVIRGFKTKFGGGGSGGGNKGGGRGPQGGANAIPLQYLILGIGFIVLLLSCIYKIDQNEEGVVLSFGEFSRTTEPGLHIKLPSPVETVEIVDVDSERTIGIGTIRENLMLTGDENIARVAYSVIWRVNNSSDFVFNVANVPSAVQDVAESAMREIVGKINLENLITDERDLVAANVQVLMQQMLDEYKAGVVVSQVELKEAQEPLAVENAFLDVVSAKQEAEQSILTARALENSLIPQANAEADRLIQDARGYKESVIAEAKGDASRFDAIYQEYKLAPRVTRQRLYLETMEEVYAGKEKIILDSDGNSGIVPYLPLDQLQKKSAN